MYQDLGLGVRIYGLGFRGNAQGQLSGPFETVLAEGRKLQPIQQGSGMMRGLGLIQGSGYLQAPCNSQRLQGFAPVLSRIPVRIHRLLGGLHWHQAFELLTLDTKLLRPGSIVVQTQQHGPRL